MGREGACQAFFQVVKEAGNYYRKGGAPLKYDCAGPFPAGMVCVRPPK